MSMFCERFKQLKIASGLKLKDLSEQMNISISNLSYYMTCREPNYDTLIRIANYFNVTTDWLIGRLVDSSECKGRCEYYQELLEEIETLKSENDVLKNKLKNILEIANQ